MRGKKVDFGTKRRKKQKSLATISLLSDDLLDLILSKVQKQCDRNSFSMVCKQWSRVRRLSVESLCILYFSSDSCAGALASFPNLVHLEVNGISSNAQIKTIAQTCPNLEVFELYGSRLHLGRKCLEALGIGCPKLKSVLLFGDKVGHAGVTWLVNSARTLMSLELHSSLIGDAALGVIGSTFITTLVLDGCHNITDHGLELLSNESSRSSRTITTMGVVMCSKITDTGVEHLLKMSSLEHLELSQMGVKITEVIVVAISKIQTLKTLKLSYLRVSDTTVVSLAQKCCNLEELDLQGCPKVTGSGIRAFSTHKCLKRLVLLGLKRVGLSDVEYLALGCPSLEPESVLVDGYRIGDPTWSTQLMHANTRSVIKFEDN